MRISDWSSDVCSSDLRGMVAGMSFGDDVRPPTEEGGDHARDTQAEHPFSGAAEIIGVHPHHPAKEHDERRDRTDHRPDAGVYEVIVMMFGTSHEIGRAHV